MSGRVEQVLHLARRHLQLDVAFVSQVTATEQRFTAVQADAVNFGLEVGGATPLEATFCKRMLDGTIPQLIPDVTAHDELMVLLDATEACGIRSYAGVPLRHSDGSLYGTLCCIGQDLAPHLDDRDAHFLSMLAELLVDDLDAERERARTHTQISATIRQQDLTLALQPVVDLLTGSCIGFEALSRFPYGPPDVVFAQADAVGLGLELERLASRTAAALVPQISGDRYLAANLTPPAAIELSQQVMQLPSLPWDRMVLEITEHISVVDYDRLRRVLEPLRERGMRVAIDDAGAGFASLHHIVMLEPDIIKIDRSLISELDRNKAQRSIVAGFVLLALDSGATLVAEGVETTEELMALTDLGVDAAQGYLLGRPSTDRADLQRWLATDNMLAELQRR